MESLFEVLNATQPRTLDDLTGNIPHALAAMSAAVRKQDPETRRLVWELIRRVKGETFAAAWKHLTTRVEEKTAGLLKRDEPREQE